LLLVFGHPYEQQFISKLPDIDGLFVDGTADCMDG
jgi:hypothetical protein